MKWSNSSSAVHVECCNKGPKQKTSSLRATHTGGSNRLLCGLALLLLGVLQPVAVLGVFNKNSKFGETIRSAGGHDYLKEDISLRRPSLETVATGYYTPPTTPRRNVNRDKASQQAYDLRVAEEKERRQRADVGETFTNYRGHARGGRTKKTFGNPASRTGTAPQTLSEVVQANTYAPAEPKAKITRKQKRDTLALKRKETETGRVAKSKHNATRFQEAADHAVNQIKAKRIPTAKSLGQKRTARPAPESPTSAGNPPKRPRNAESDVRANDSAALSAWRIKKLAEHKRRREGASDALRQLELLDTDISQFDFGDSDSDTRRRLSELHRRFQEQTAYMERH